MRRRKAQLNAISRSYTEKYQREARADLDSLGIDFYKYCNLTGYKGSECRLVSDIKSGAKRTAESVRKYRELIAK